MSDKSNLEQVIEEAPFGRIMAGTIDIYKVPHTDKITGKTTPHVIMIGKVGDQEFRKELQPAVLRALAGKGPMGKILGKILGTGEGLPAPAGTDG